MLEGKPSFEASTIAETFKRISKIDLTFSKNFSEGSIDLIKKVSKTCLKLNETFPKSLGIV